MIDQSVDYNNLQFKKDINYINNEIISKQNNGKYCKYSRPLNSVSVIDMTISSNIEYWTRVLKNKITAKDMTTLVETIENKFKNNLLPLEDMIKLINMSSDTDKEKASIIKAITKNN